MIFCGWEVSDDRRSLTSGSTTKAFHCPFVHHDVENVVHNVTHHNSYLLVIAVI